MKRTLSLLIAMILVISMLPPVGVYAAEPVTVYLDPVNGDNGNSGTEEAPVKDFEAAYALLQAAGGTVVMLEDVTFTAVTTLPACDHPVTITSKTGAEGIRSNSHLIVGGETTFENISLTLTKASTGTTICGGGHKLTMGEGVTTVPFVNSDGSYYFCLAGGFYSGSTAASTDLTIRSGQYRYVYAGGYTTGVNGNAKLTMTGGTTANLATIRGGTVTGDVQMEFSGTAKVTGNIYAGAATTGNLKGDCTVTLGQGCSFKGLYCGSNGSGSIAGGVEVIVDGYDGSFSYFKGKGGSSCTGTVGSSRLVLRSGSLAKAPTDFGTVDIDIPENKTMTLGCSLAADTLAGAGTLCFSGAAELTAEAVTGEVSCAIAGEVLENHTYVTAPAGSAITFPAESGVTEHSGQWVKQDLNDFAGLVLQTDPANKVVLYTGLWRSGDTDTHTEVTPYMTEIVDGIAYYYYPNLQGTYYVRGTRSGYIGVYQNIYMSEEEAATKTVETVTLEKKGSGGYVPANVYVGTDEVLENEAAWKSDASMYPKYAPYLQNPVFRENRDAHRMTTGEELAAELAALDQADDDMYRFSLGKSAHYDLDIPLVIFTRTDLSAATTLEEAAEALDGSDKLTVYYRAQMHGNEPAATEGALAMLYKLQDGYADELLDKINLIVIPRINPDGSYLYQRRLYSNLDPNRDQLRLESEEMQAVQRGYLLFDPEVVIDGHERMWSNPWGDMQICTGFTPMNSDEYCATALALDQAAFAELEANGLNGYYYAGVVNSYDPNMGSAYYPMSGSIYVLLESRGIHESDEAMERRVVGHMAAAEGILDYLYENATKVKSLIAAERASVAGSGATYEEDDLFVLDTNSRTTTDADAESWGNLNTKAQTINWATGEVTFPVRYPTVDDKVVRTRTAPTAYVIPADITNIDSILHLLEQHGFTYSRLPQGATLPLQRYSGDTTEATLSGEANVRFADGCYVFTMNNEKGLLLATLMEPDNTNAVEYYGSLAQMDLLNVADTYRYIRDLNGEGMVDYTVTDASFVEITVWLDGTNGDDTADGLTETTAVKTLEQAYTLMEAGLEGASADSKANLKIVGLYELGTDRVYMPEVSFHVTISGKTPADGFQYTGGSSQSTRIVDIGGDTTFRDMTIHSNSAGSYNHLNARGHKVVIDEGVTCTTKKANCYFTLAGGSYTGTDASTDLTVRSGSWRTIYVGGYLAHVTGHAKADISGCWVYYNIAPSYRGNVGSVDIKIENTTVNAEDEKSGIYAGPTQRKNTSQGHISGDVTITLGENVEAKAVYAASCNEAIISGTVTIIADGADLSQLPVYAKAPTTTGTTAAAVLKLGADVEKAVTLDAALPLDLNGYDITGDLTVDGTLTVKDSATDDYDVSDGVYGQITGTVTGTLEAAEGYVAAADGFHKFDQYISHVNLRTGSAGIYYTATVLADEVLKAEFASSGVAVSLTDLPGADFETDADTLYTTGTNGVIIENILRGDFEDADRAIMDIYAASYVKLKSGEVLTSDETIAYSLYDVLLLLQQQNPEAFESFVTTHNITNWF